MLTTVNYERASAKQNKFLVIHYVGALGDAQNNCKYFKDTFRGASAHYFIGHGGDVWQCVEDTDVAWHCGGVKNYKHPTCRNSNSIGIELCCKKRANGTWYFEEATLTAAIELTKELMSKYNIPITNVIRHYDVTGKICPEPFVRDTAAWNSFKAQLTSANVPTTGYLVRVTADELNVRTGVGVGFKIATVIKKNQVFTIVDECQGWGKLKSGVGWINLKYTERV